MAETDRLPTKALELFEHESAAAAEPLSECELDAAGRNVAAGVDEERVGPDWRRPGSRWAVPALAVVVVIQSAWLITDRFRPDLNGTAKSATATVEAVSDQSTQATSGVRPAGTAERAAVSATGQAGSAKKSVASINSTAAKRVAAADAPAGRVAALGSVSIAVPFQVEVYENGRFVGINGESGVRLTPGSHRIELVNESLGYRSSHTVAISSGRMTQMNVALPMGTLHLNAAPWAEVLIDGNSVGETPLANLQVPIGSHRVTFRHPQWGEQTRNIVVAAESSTRMGVDLQK